MPGDKKNISNTTSGDKKAGWFITYTDLCTLLLTFFVLIFSMSVIDPDRRKEALNSLIGAFKFLPEGRSLSGKEKPDVIPKPSIPMTQPSSLTEGTLKQLSTGGLFGPEADILREEDRIMIRFTDRLIFEERSSVLLPEGEKYLTALGTYLKNDNQEIEIRGHTDPFEVIDLPDRESFSWRLSTERALSVYRLFIRLGIAPQRMSAHGMSFFHQIVAGNQFPSLRYRNRRVEILLGKNPSIPANIYSLKADKKTFFQYKKLFFPLFGGESGENAGKGRPEN